MMASPKLFAARAKVTERGKSMLPANVPDPTLIVAPTEAICTACDNKPLLVGELLPVTVTV